MQYKLKTTGEKLQSYQLADRFHHVSFGFPLTQDILDFLGLDELPDDPLPEPAPYVPPSVTMRQARLALLSAGVLSGVDAAIASLPSPEKEAAQIEWNYGGTVERASPLVSMLGQALGLDADALDALFVQAALL